MKEIFCNGNKAYSRLLKAVETNLNNVPLSEVVPGCGALLFKLNLTPQKIYKYKVAVQKKRDGIVEPDYPEKLLDQFLT